MVDAYNSLLLKKEVTYAVDAVPTAALNAALTRNLSMKPLAVDRLERTLDRPSRGASRSGATNKRMEMTYELELAGSGVAGTAPKWMEHLEICAMEAPTIAAGVSATQKYAALGVPLSSATVHGYRGGNQRRRGRGARGSITAINFTAGAYPFIGISLIALLGVAPYDQLALGAPDFTAWKEPLEVSTTNTLFTLDGYAAVMRSFVLQDNGEVVMRNLVGSNYVRRGNHSMGGKIVIEAPDFAAKNYFGTLETGALIATQLIHGVGAGKIVQVDSVNLQVVDITESAEGDVAMFEIDVLLTINVGQDDILITAK